MKYFVEIGGEEKEVVLRRDADGQLRAECDQGAHIVDVAVVATGSRYTVLLDHDSFDVVAERSGEDALQLRVGGRRLDVRVEDARQRAARRIAGARPPGPSRLESVMPGVVRQVMVTVGDAVSAGQPLLILEAMKMENELCAEQPGVVKEILVEPGTAVDGGAALIVLDPPADR